MFRDIFAVHRTPTQTQQFRNELQSMLQHIVGRLQLRRDRVSGIELENGVEEVLRQQLHDRRVASEVEGDLRVWKGGEKQDELT